MSELEDREEIRELLVKYCQAGDTGDIDAFADCFTEDAVVDANGFLIESREVIRKNFEDNRPLLYAANPMQHFYTNFVITVNGDEAEASSYLLLVDCGDQPSVMMTGVQRDRLRRVGGRWRFHTREIRSQSTPSSVSSDSE